MEESDLEAKLERLEKPKQEPTGYGFTGLAPPEPPDLTKDVERLAAFTAKHSELIDQVRSVARKSGYVNVADFERASFLPELQKLRLTARLLKYEALVALDRGDSDGFAASVESIFGIAQQLNSTPLLVGQLARTAIIGIGTNVVHQALSRLQLSRDASQRLASGLDDLDLIDNFREGLIAERAMMAECFQDLQLWEHGDKLTTRGNLYLSLYAPADLCFYLEQMQVMIDALENTPQEAFRIADATTDIGDLQRPPPISATLVPAFRPFMVALMRTDFQSDACRTGLGIEDYRVKHDQIPESLAELVPEFLDEVPIDHLDGKPLRYQTTADGYQVYSVGHNGKDGDGPGSLYPHGPKLQIEVPHP